MRRKIYPYAFIYALTSTFTVTVVFTSLHLLFAIHKWPSCRIEISISSQLISVDFASEY